MDKKLLTIIAAAGLLISSCSTPKNITYFPELTTGTVIRSENVNDIKVRPEDKLSIIVTAQDPALSYIFNLVTSNNNLGTNSITAGSIGATGNGGNGQMAYYTVDQNGEINFPVLGKVKIEGLNRSQVAQKIFDELTSHNLLKDPIITVEFVNTHVSVLGEVASPGLYNFNDDHLTILDAIAAAGDLKINGLRENILVLRANGDGQQEAYRVNLLDAQSLASSPVFYLQQDDVIYVEPNDKVKRETTPNGNSPFTPSFWISMGSVAMTVATLIVTLTR